LNWNAAKRACEAMGSNLVVVNSQAENQAIASKLKANRAWIGLHRDPNDNSRWLWVDGSRATYTNWERGEPNNPSGEKCGEMYPLSYPAGSVWNDWICSKASHYICEASGKLENTMF